jgi:hypothetical protein
MRQFSEYHIPVRPLFSLSVAVLAVGLFVALPAAAQVNGAPASVTSPGFGGHAVNGPPASVTSVGPQGYAPPHHNTPLSSTGNGFHHDGDLHHDGGHDRDGHRQHRSESGVGAPVWYAYPVPYAVEGAPTDDQQQEASDDDVDYQGGPTVFDRRGFGPRSYVPPTKDTPPAHSAERMREEAPAVEPDPPMPPTLLVFKDGRTMEVANYAILGQTLFDLSPGHRHKFAIRDLDVEATRKQNDERGVTFQVPQTIQAN